jgi:hypothetical protein
LMRLHHHRANAAVEPTGTRLIKRNDKHQISFYLNKFSI